MYHISKDARSERSARLIIKGLDSCLQRKRFADLSVSDIQRASGVSRSTFYRLFDNPVDILTMLCDSVISEGVKKLEQLESYNGSSILLIQIELWRKHRSVLEMVVKSERPDLIYQSNMKYHQKFRQSVMDFYGLSQTEEKYQRIIMSAIQAAGLKLLLEEDDSVSSHEIRDKISDALARMYDFFIRPESPTVNNRPALKER